jgi:hypothetical protein
MTDTGTLNPPFLSKYSPDGGQGFAGWHYRIQRDHEGEPMTLQDGSLLVVAWPADHPQPVPARLLYVPPEWLTDG